MWARNGGPEPPGVDALLQGQPRPAIPVWKGDLAPAENGVVILGTPVGSKEFVARILQRRLVHQKHLLELLPRVPHLQAAWLLLLYCAVPRANHLVRSLPPDIVQEFAEAHDESIWSTFQELIVNAVSSSKEVIHAWKMHNGRVHEARADETVRPEVRVLDT